MGNDDKQLWLYDPSKTAAGVAAGVFLIPSLLHLVFLKSNRFWFCLPFAIGGFFESGGYAVRVISAQHQTRNWPYAVQTILILLAPAFFSASIYMTLGRLMIRAQGERLSPIRLGWLTKIFVLGDTLCFLVQAAGASMLTNAAADDHDAQQRGKVVALGGLILQIVVFLFYDVVAITWHWRMRHRTSSKHTQHVGGFKWQSCLWIVYFISVLISTRNVCRALEFSEGAKGYLFSHEWTLYALDAVPMLFVLSICLCWYWLFDTTSKDGHVEISQQDEMGHPEEAIGLHARTAYSGYEYGYGRLTQGA